MQVVNTRLMSHPINWLYVWATLALASLAWTMAAEAYCNGQQPNISPD